MSTSAAPSLVRASVQDGTYPRPQLVRTDWVDLCGTWQLATDDADEGLAAGWSDAQSFDRTVVVPFPPESPASGVADTGFHPVLWYRRDLSADDLDSTGRSADRPTVLLHLGAVDHRADVWLNGTYLGGHVGGSTPFTLDVTRAIDPDRAVQNLVVRAFDDPADVEQHRGKQDWQRDAHSIWYDRTSGIWQPVWLEAVPELHVTHLTWTTDLQAGSVTLDVELNRRPAAPVDLRVEIDHETSLLASVTVQTSEPRSTVQMSVPRQRNGQDYETLLWSPEHPTLLDARVQLVPAAGQAPAAADGVSSYLGLRSASTGGGHFLLNDRPYYVRSVLNQGFWPQSHLAAPSADALRAEVQLIKDLGFNANRVHQKIEDPRFLFWADRLGLLVWEEAPSAYQFSGTAVRRMLTEWSEAIHRDASHPCIVTWVPINESWGVQHVAHDEQMKHYTQALWHLTHALDGTRPVVSNDGWELTDSDVWSVHDYDASPEALAERYRDPAALTTLLEGVGPAGRRMRLTGEADRGQPVMLTEFGGITFAAGAEDSTWGYSRVGTADDLDAHLSAVVGAVRGAHLAGFCYTQLADTLQEANGLVDEHRQPKIPAERIRQIISG